MTETTCWQSDELYLVNVEALDRTFRFLNNSRTDHIQKFLANGKIYEEDELELISRHAPNARRLLDVGANVGTHTIYLAHKLNLERAVPIEPQPCVLDILKANLGLNWHPSFDLTHLGIGLGAKGDSAQITRFSPANLGGTQLQLIDHTETAAPKNTIPIEPGDARFSPGDFDLIKIDVEGMEEAVIEGLRNTMTGFDGLIFVEVYDSNVASFGQYIASRGWKKVDEYRRYKRCTNWLLRRV